MPYELGGRADKSGNRFEIRWAIYQILKVLEEKLDYVILEALGDDEQGVDIWIGKKDGSREGQQCKGRNGSKEYWDYGTVNAKGIFGDWKYQLDREESNTVALVSPLAFTLLEDLIRRAENTNINPKDFYECQILSASEEFRRFFNNFCKVMDINPEQNSDLIKCIAYLKRIACRQFPDTELKEIILSIISYLLIGNEEDIYETFVAWIVEGDILGKQINQSVLYEFLNKKDIQLKSLSNDNRITPRLLELNKEYKASFIPLNDGVIERDEFSICRKAIELENSLIIHGKAGRGKSGCTEDIINYCEENTIPYLAIKLDKRIPNGNADKWGEDLGLPSSISHCIHSISKNRRAVIILDQLDALRWTQAHSSDALLVCDQIINQVERLNYERKDSISIVFVCRTYDLENDNNIRALFKKDDKKSNNINWHKILVNELNDDTVKDIIGERYETLTGKLKEILRSPSNIYIWEQLDSSKEYSECSTASHLISEWWKQLSIKCFQLGLSENDVNTTKEELVTCFDNLGRIHIPVNILKANESCLRFLSSSGFLIIQENKVSFTHQSILDYFLAEKMLIKYYKNEDIVNIIGNKEKQTPGRRYQVQMLMQNLVELDSQDFLDAGQKILNAKEIRYSIKFVFFEVLSQVDVLDANIKNFIVKSCEDQIYSKHIINNVIFSRPHYIRLLRDCGILDRWFDITEKKDIVFNLLFSIAPNYDLKDVLFIEKHIFRTQEDDENFYRCFLHDISGDTDEMFELRIKLYNKYPQMADSYLNFKSMFKNSEMRTIRVFAILLENKINSEDKNIYINKETFLDVNTDIYIKNGVAILNTLIPYIPRNNDEIVSFSDWSSRYFENTGLERACIQIVKKANVALTTLDPESFYERYKKYMGKGYCLFNEIILDALYLLPEKYSDTVITYLCDDLDKNIFDNTSGNGDELLFAKLVLGKFSQHCSHDVFNLLEETVISYISPDSKKRYHSRIDYNRENKDCKIYWSFWGDFQKEILGVLPQKRLSDQARDLIGVLKRRFPEGATHYKYSGGHTGWVSSPIGGKKLSNKRWLELLTNRKINHKKKSSWIEVEGGFHESSIGQFSSSLSSAVSNEPERMIAMFLSQDEQILDTYIYSLFSGVSQSKSLNDVPISLLEAMILRYPHDYTSYRASSICTIIEKKKSEKWSQKILDILKDIAINHRNPEIDKVNITNKEDKKMNSFNMLKSNAINCVRGNAARAIANLLWNDSFVFEQFKETIEKLSWDENPAVKFACLFALWPSYNIDRNWASEKILNLYEQDYRLAGFSDTKNMLFRLYSKYPDRVLNIIQKCYKSEDEKLIEMGAYCLSEMFILKNEFIDEMNNVDIMSKEQAKAVLHMAIKYFEKDEYNSLVKNIILRFKASTLDLEMPMSRLFHDDRIDLERDSEFLIEVMNSGLRRRMVNSFVHYLEKQSKSVIDYKDIILSMSYQLVNNEHDEDERIFGMEDQISKLVIGLYDETSGFPQPELKNIANQCLDIWDLMFEKQIGPIRRLSQEMMDR